MPLVLDEEEELQRQALFGSKEMPKDRIEQQRRGLFGSRRPDDPPERRRLHRHAPRGKKQEHPSKNVAPPYRLTPERYDFRNSTEYNDRMTEAPELEESRVDVEQGSVTASTTTTDTRTGHEPPIPPLVGDVVTIPGLNTNLVEARDQELDERDQLIKKKTKKTRAITQHQQKHHTTTRSSNNSVTSNRSLFKTAIRDYSMEIPRTDSGSVVSRRTISSRYKNDKRQMAVVYRQFGADASVLQVECTETMPEFKSPEDVIIKVQASTVSLEDCLERRGFCFNVMDPTCLPMTPGQDVVGHVVICGDNVDSVKEGDRVAALVRNGGNTRYISVPQSSLVKVPRKVDSAEAAAMVATYTAAYQALKSVSPATDDIFSLEGKKVLVIGGMNAVSQALIQMCLKARAEVLTTAPSRRHAYIRNVLGAEPLPEHSREWLPEVYNGMDLVFDGQCEDGLEKSSKALNRSGELVCFGHSAMLREKKMGILGAPFAAHMNRIWSLTMTTAKTVDIWESFERNPDLFKKNLKSLFHLLKWDKVKPHIARRVALSEVADSHSKLEQGDVRGIVVCLPWKRVGSKDIVMGANDDSASVFSY